jgi:flagellar hook-associated protein FlgK
MPGLISSLHHSSGALRVHSKGLEVVGKNLANINNRDYAKQRIAIGDRGSIETGVAVESLGIEVIQLKQNRDAILDKTVMRETSALEKLIGEKNVLDAAQIALGQFLDRTKDSTSINTAAGASGGGISDSLVDFFNSWESLSVKPSDIGVKEQVLQNSQILAEKINLTLARLKQVQDDVKFQVETEYEEYTKILSEIRDINNEIAKAEIGRPMAAVDLRDKRQAKLQELSRFSDANFSTVLDSNGQIQVTSKGTESNILTLLSAQNLSVFPSKEDLRIDFSGSGGLATFTTNAFLLSENLIVTPIPVDDTNPVDDTENPDFNDNENFNDNDLDPNIPLLNNQATNQFIFNNSNNGLLGNYNIPQYSTNDPQSSENIDTSKNRLNILSSEIYSKIIQEPEISESDLQAFVKNIAENNLGVTKLDSLDVRKINDKFSVDINLAKFNSTNIDDAANITEIHKFNFSYTHAAKVEDVSSSFKLYTRSAGLQMDAGLSGRISAAQDQVQSVIQSIESLAKQLEASVNAVYGAKYFTTSTNPDFKIQFNSPEINVGNLKTAALGSPTGSNKLALDLAGLANKKFNTNTTTSSSDLINGTLVEFFNSTVTRLATYLNSVNTSIEDRKLSLEMAKNSRDNFSGVSQDEEITDMMKFQRSFQASARHMNVIDTLLEQVVNRLGVG